LVLRNSSRDENGHAWVARAAERAHPTPLVTLCVRSFVQEMRNIRSLRNCAT